MSSGVVHISDKLSDWECVELYLAYRGGATKTELRRRYRMSGKTLNRTLLRVEAEARRRGLAVA